MDWIDEITLISEVSEKDRVNKNGFATKPKESTVLYFVIKNQWGIASISRASRQESW